MQRQFNTHLPPVEVKLVIRHNGQELIGTRAGWIPRGRDEYKVLIEEDNTVISCFRNKTEWAIY